MDVLKKLKKQVALAMKTAYQGITHKDARTDHLIRHVANKVHEERLHLYVEDRLGNVKAKPVPNVLAVGEAKLKLSSLGTFNHKVCAMIEGREYDKEANSLPQIALAVNAEDGSQHSEDIAE